MSQQKTEAKTMKRHLHLMNVSYSGHPETAIAATASSIPTSTSYVTRVDEGNHFVAA